MKTQPLKGMRDLLPREQALRDYIPVSYTHLDVYKRQPLPRSSRPAPTGRPFSEKAVWLRP